MLDRVVVVVQRGIGIAQVGLDGTVVLVFFVGDGLVVCMDRAFEILQLHKAIADLVVKLSDFTGSKHRIIALQALGIGFQRSGEIAPVVGSLSLLEKNVVHIVPTAL